ncbi:hypothetical protein F4825DRAFT_469110 [Nemania diffusa]|nr:hypothetical protein F4825DRAFT_469110 [Nemania diffusa]
MDIGQDASGISDNQYPVYVGIWTNWSRGRVLGSTLTLSRQDADLLIAFTAFFIAFVTTRAWRIICFVFHRLYSTADPRDAIYHQRQTIFRNSSSPESGIVMLIWLLWANRHVKGWFRPLPAAIIAVVCISVFTVAGGFSSQISTAVGNEALIKSSNCGNTLHSVGPDDPLYFPLTSNQATTTSSAANYAQQCYSAEKNSLLDCNRFSMQQVGKTIDTQASCPFRGHICRNESTNVRIDSGYLDSHKILGLNAPPDERILFRNVLHCAPLTTAGFTYERNTSLGRYTFYQYGTYKDSNIETNYVHAAASVQSQYALPATADISVTYTNYVLEKDADLFLVFLSGNGVVFTQPSDDQWYHLNTTPSPFSLGSNVPELLELYIPQEPASPLGCTNQYQYCNTAFQGTSGCGPLASPRDAIVRAAPFFDANDVDLETTSFRSGAGARFGYLLGLFYQNTISGIEGILQQVGAAGLTSQKTLYGGIQGPIASDQWQRDVSNWWDISMAIHQSTALSLAYMPDNSAVRAARLNYTTPELQKLCNNQKIRTTAYASFSLFGLFFTLTVGLLLTLVSYLVEPISSCLHKRKGYNQYPHLEWTANSTLQSRE